MALYFIQFLFKLNLTHEYESNEHFNIQLIFFLTNVQ